ncbi:MAG: type IV secretion system protein, partial [Dermatophilaceae bacterium]
DSWAGIASANSAWQNSVNAVSGAGLGLIALLGVIPAAISLLVTALVREAAILVIAATIPIVAAGLVAEATARWFWTALRWLLALVLLTPTVAIVMAVGLQLAAGAAGGTQTAGQTAGTDAGQSAVTALVAAAVLLVSVFCPLALFKLFAFVDPGTPSGQRLRTSMADNSTAGTAASSTGTTRQESDTREQVESRWTQALARVSEAHRVLGSASAELDVQRRAGAGRRRRRRGHRPRPHPRVAPWRRVDTGRGQLHRLDWSDRLQWPRAGPAAQ